MTTWKRYIFEGALTHVVPKDLDAALVTEMCDERGFALKTFPPEYVAAEPDTYQNPRAVNEWAIDFGGTYRIGRPNQIVRLPGLEIEIACESVDLAIRQLRRLEARRLSTGASYFKLHHWHFALVMLLTHRQSLLEHAYPVDTHRNHS